MIGVITILMDASNNYRFSFFIINGQDDIILNEWIKLKIQSSNNKKPVTAQKGKKIIDVVG